MKNEKWYKETFDKVHVPEELLGKVMDMENQTEKKAKRGWRYAMGALAAAFGLFVASNGICYAATGETWVSRMTVYFNGEKYEGDITWQEYENGKLIGMFPVTVPVVSDHSMESVILGIIAEAGEVIDKDLTYSIDDRVFTMIEGDDDYAAGNCEVSCEVETDEDGRVWLRVNQNGACVAEADITADLADGTAEGDITYDDHTYHYQVTRKTNGAYEVMLSAEIAEE